MKKRYAFTLVEMLIAILVFSIGVLAVLRVIMGNISVMDYTNRKLQSTVLAKEGIELLYNVRDSNLEKNLSWNCVMNPLVYKWKTDDLNYFANGLPSNSSFESIICSDHFGVSKLLQLSFNKDFYIIQNTKPKLNDFDALFEQNRLCLYTDTVKNMSWYAYCADEQGGKETSFARYLSFSSVDLDENVHEQTFGVKYAVDEAEGSVPTQAVSVAKILKVESHVLFKKGESTGDVVFESFIGNY